MRLTQTFPAPVPRSYIATPRPTLAPFGDFQAAASSAACKVSFAFTPLQDFPNEFILAFADQIHHAKFRRVHFQFFGEQIHMRFGGERGLDRARRAPETARHRIRVNLQRFHITVVDR